MKERMERGWMRDEGEQEVRRVKDAVNFTAHPAIVVQLGFPTLSLTSPAVSETLSPLISHHTTTTTSSLQLHPLAMMYTPLSLTT